MDIEYVMNLMKLQWFNEWPALLQSNVFQSDFSVVSNVDLHCLWQKRVQALSLLDEYNLICSL